MVAVKFFLIKKTIVGCFFDIAAIKTVKFVGVFSPKKNNAATSRRGIIHFKVLKRAENLFSQKYKTKHPLSILALFYVFYDIFLVKI